MTQVIGAGNPLNAFDVGIEAKPSVADIDGDGDADVVVGESNGTLAYFRNTGSATNPVYAQQTGAANPFNGIDVGSYSAPAADDVDGDGDVDLFVGANDGTVHYYKNTGTATNPTYVQQTHTDNPFNNVYVGDYVGIALGDVDADGRVDALLGAHDGTLRYYRNTGSATVPVYTLQTGGTDLFNGVDVGVEAKPVLGDVDGDGDLDAAVGASDGTIWYFKNTGAATSPVYVSQSGAANPFNGLDVGTYSTPVLGDVNGDGDLDAIVGASDGTLFYFRNDAVPPAVNYALLTGAANPFNGINNGFDSYPTPALGDVDGDGDLDLVTGVVRHAGSMRYFKNTGTATAPAYTQQTGAANPFNGIATPNSQPALADVDGDGDLDAVVAEFSGGGLMYFKNTGVATSPVLVQQTGAANPFNGFTGDFYQSPPSFGDVDGDGDLDLVAGLDIGLAYLKNTGSATNPVYVQLIGAASPFHDVSNWIIDQPHPALGDMDRDGDLDLVLGSLSGRLNYFKNTGTATSPVYVHQLFAANPFDGVDVGNNSAVALGDIDGDGDPDVVHTEQDGSVYSWRPNRAPVVDVGNPDQTFSGPGNHSFTMPADAFLDLDNNALTYSATLASGAALPAWLSFNPATQTFSGNPLPTDTSPLQIRVLAHDSVGGVGFDDFQLSLVNVGDNSTHVTTLADEDNGNADPLHGAGTSLREAINYTNTLGTFPEITFDASLTSGGPATIALGGTELAITSSLEITGPGANLLTISANNASRVINVSGGGQFWMSGITITGGNAAIGAGVNNDGSSLNFNAVVLTGNTASAFGGGLASLNVGEITVRSSTISNNTAGNEAGAIESQGLAGSPSTVTLINSTISGNITNGSGLGAISNVASGGTATLTLQNCTIANNTGAAAGGVLNAVNSGSAVTTYIATIFDNAGPNVTNFGGTVTSLGHNLSSDDTGNLTATGDLPDTNPSLNPLGANGGPTPTMPLRASSPAINAGVAIPGINTDQRGITRPQGATPDIGAFERSATAATLTNMSFEFETRQAVTFNFSDDASVTFSRSSYTLQNLTTGATLPASTGSLSFNSAGTQAVLVLTNLLSDGNYRITSGTSQLDFFILAGDANRDRAVDITDLGILATNWQQSPRAFSQGDFNYDTIVDITDLGILATNWQKLLPGAATRPHPIRIIQGLIE
jgi:CSLREA domain-containing protein